MLVLWAKLIWAKDGGSGTPQYFFRKQIHQSKFNKVYSWMRLFVQFILQVKLLYSYKLPLLTRTKLLAKMFWDIKCKYFSARVFLSQDGYRWISSCGPSRVGQSSCHGNSFTKIPSEMEVALLHKEHLGTSRKIWEHIGTSRNHPVSSWTIWVSYRTVKNTQPNLILILYLSIILYISQNIRTPRALLPEQC